MKFVEAAGMHMPAIGLGTWELRGRDCVRLMQDAVKIGYRHFDTAQAYENEAEVGEGLHASGLQRNEAFVTTKIWPANHAPADFARSVKESLARLKLDYVDLLLLHWPSKEIPLADTIGALCKVKKEGGARNIGVSNFTVALLDEAVKHASEPIACNQIEVHPYLDQAKVLAACRRHGIGVVAYSPIARGRLTDDGVLDAIGKRHGKTAAQVSLRFLVQQGLGVVPRTSKVERLKENFTIFDFELPDAEMKEIGALSSKAHRVVNIAVAPVWD
jgi:diketogulonate reductase-like aldo/keto reductase